MSVSSYIIHTLYCICVGILKNIYTLKNGDVVSKWISRHLDTNAIVNINICRVPLQERILKLSGYLCKKAFFNLRVGAEGALDNYISTKNSVRSEGHYHG